MSKIKKPKVEILKIKIQSKILLNHYPSGHFHLVTVKTFAEANRLLKPFLVLQAPELYAHITLIFKSGKEFKFTYTHFNFLPIQAWLENHVEFLQANENLDGDDDWEKEVNNYINLFNNYVIGDVPETLNLNEIRV